MSASRRRSIEEKRAMVLLNRLGKTPEEVASSLMGITGQRGSVDSSPLALWMSMHMNGPVAISRTEAHLPKGGTVPLPEAVIEAEEAFDRGLPIGRRSSR